jgi:SAM-dependent methyltransferase
MTSTDMYSFTRYLSSKKTVDDRALNRQVFDALRAEISAMNREQPLRVLEIGCGIGTMVERALDWGLLGRAEYTALDEQPENIAEAATRLPMWSKDRGYQCRVDGPGRMHVTSDDINVMVQLEAADVFEFIARCPDKSQWDVLIANAFLDLVDVRTALPSLLALLKPGGLFYFTITFDGATILQPEIDPELDARIEALYHQTMDRRVTAGKPSGDSRCGRHFFHHARLAGAEIVAAGSSDWVVFAGPRGYSADEAFFLHFIVQTMGSSLGGHPELDAQRLAEWIEKRHAQIADRTLVYIAHQMDFLGRIPW